MARQKELKYFLAKEVWLKRPRNEAYHVTGKRLISVKRVDVNKGDDLNPNYRSRLVARDIRLPGEEAIFAPTPPLEALRTVLSAAATDWKGAKKHIRDPESKYRTQISFIDVSRAYFNAKRDPNVDLVYVDLPHEDLDKLKDMVGLLLVHLCVTRAAADGWHCEYSGLLEELGFVKGDASACIFRHHLRNIVCSVHGDDFTSSGSK